MLSHSMTQKIVPSPLRERARVRGDQSATCGVDFSLQGEVKFFSIYVLSTLT